MTEKTESHLQPESNIERLEDEIIVEAEVEQATFLKWIKKSPSYEYLQKVLAFVGLYNVGLTVAWLQHPELPKSFIPIIWYSTLVAPMIEEVTHRSKLIPFILNEIEKKTKITIVPKENQKRIVANITFALGHVSNLPQKFLAGMYFQRVAQSRGVEASIASHSVLNATVVGIGYLMTQLEKLPSSEADKIKTGLLAVLYSEILAISTVGIKELIDDKRTMEILEDFRTYDTLKDVKNIGAIEEVILELFKSPSTEGYKFKSGVELVYMLGLLENREIFHQPEMLKSRAIAKVQYFITQATSDPQLTKPKLDAAMNYLQDFN